MSKWWGALECLAAIIITILVVMVFWALSAHAAQAATENSQSVTGIPIDYLFGSVGALGSLVYWDMKRELRNMGREGEKRAGNLRHVENAVRKICYKLNIDYREDDDE